MNTAAERTALHPEGSSGRLAFVTKYYQGSFHRGYLYGTPTTIVNGVIMLEHSVICFIYAMGIVLVLNIYITTLFQNLLTKFLYILQKLY